MIRELYDTFELKGLDGPHQCLLQPSMHMDILEAMKMSGKPLSISMLKMIIIRLLTALDFLHNDANVIHTGTASISQQYSCFVNALQTSRVITSC